jgi:hypothetical protein
MGWNGKRNGQLTAADFAALPTADQNPEHHSRRYNGFRKGWLGCARSEEIAATVEGFS